MNTLIVIVVIVIALVIWMVNSSLKSLDKAKKAYLESLEALKNNPTNAELKQQTLALGRVYSNLTRDSKGVTTVDEVALMNDINAACASAIGQNNISQTLSIEERLKKLNELFDKGLLTESEYNSRKQEIISSI
ncbi:SHOCT domain-containing protein [Rodentibacter ratti]|uniref:SHOCT domain-containing protein n=1 Tax=Rodentibacter ratti TaxID=1906745 RepID=A0A1V3L4W0_9PAST|nr:SHOCT domain-containing protein [Rodentibacter ratti]OOF84969.1 hypothetical protein BKG88_09415 [Rodentibacter ratti]